MKRTVLILMVLFVAFFGKAQTYLDPVVISGMVNDLQAIASADLDGDGDNDLIIGTNSDYYANVLMWYKNDGNGNLKEYSYIDKDFNIREIAVGDLNNDGYVDVIVPCESADRIYWYENDGTGSFEKHYIYIDITDRIYNVDIADIDGDGYNDILVPSSKPYSEIFWLKNDQDETFTKKLISAVNYSYPADAVAVDMDSDGDLDIVYTAHDEDKLAWFENAGGGDFTDGNGNVNEHVIADTIDNAFAIDVADVDNDNDLDIVLVTFLSEYSDDSKAYLFENQGNQTFAASELNLAGSFYDILIADIDYDNAQDIIIANTRVGSSKIFLLPGDENYENSYVLTDQADEVQDLDINDMDGDNKIDLISASFNDSKAAWYKYNTADGSFAQNLADQISTNQVESVYAADIDGDGEIDVLSASSSDNKIAWFKNLGDFSFSTDKVVSTSCVSPQDIVAIDLDGDNDYDVVSASLDDVIAWHENDGSGTFTMHIVSDTTISASAVYAVDFNKDGYVDILAAADPAYSDTKTVLSWYENDGNQNFTWHSIASGVSGIRQIVVVDLDKDNDLDVLTASARDDRIAWFENDGNFNFTRHDITTTADGARSVAAEDMDGDGDWDVIAGSEADNTIAWYENDGNQNFSVKHDISTSANYVKEITVLDLENDGDLDVISVNYNLARLGWYDNDGNQNFTEKTTAELSNGTAVFAYDFDGDSDKDIVAARPEQVYVFENNSLEILQQPLDRDLCGPAVATYVVQTKDCERYNWMVSVDSGKTFTYLVNSTKYSGVYTNTLDVNATADDDGHLLVCRLANSGGATYTDTVKLLVDVKAPEPTVTSVDAYLDAAGNATIYAAYFSLVERHTITDSVLSKNTFECGEIGTNDITVTTEDNCGNNGTFTVTVNVLDTISPALTTNDYSVELDSTGKAYITGDNVIYSESDNCSIADTVLSKTSFDCSNLGDNDITVTITDAGGNSTQGTAKITVEDKLAPWITTTSKTIYLDADGNASVSPEDFGPVDNCSVSSASLDKSNYNCSNIGTNTTKINLSDGVANSAVYDVDVIVKDTMRPSLTVQDVTLLLDASGNATLTEADAVVSKSDNCTDNPQITFSQTDFNCSDVGTKEITVTATDESGNSVSKSITVTITENEAPVLTTQNATVYLDANGDVTVSQSDVVVSVSDNCDDNPVVTLSKTSFNCSNLGDNTITVTATDKAGNSVSKYVTVTVADNIAPSLTTKNISISLDENGEATITASDVIESVSDNCSYTTSIDKSSFNCSNLGDYIVTVTATDGSGNSVSKTATVTVVDDLAPELSTTNVTIYLDSDGNASISESDVVLSVSDNCNPDPSVTLSKTSFDCSNLGNNTVTVTAYDGNDNSVSKDVTVTVVDDFAPVLTTQNTTVYLDANGEATISQNDVVVGVSDNCDDNPVVTLSKSSFDCSNAGTNTVTVTATDANGKSTSQDVTVTVIDNISPVLTTQDIEVSLDENGEATITAADVISSVDDNCSYTTSIDKSSFDCSNTGENTVTVTVTDASGNQVSGTANVTVVDDLAPVISCVPDKIVYADNSGIYTVSGTEFDLVENSDNCTVASITNDLNNSSSLDGVELPVGTHTITWTVTDEADNSSQCTFTVTVNEFTAAVDAENTIKVYPNPTTGVFQINTSDKNVESLQVVDITGKVVLQQELKSNKTTIDLTKYAGGIYTLKIRTSEGIKLFKILKY